ncbi:MAG: glycerol kinase GlpK [Lachnospiraceae bacterium]|nr:glycerol kinase GlpK [Lachnospiraceae bacterium]
MQKFICAIDQGTTSSRCILFDERGQICSMAQKEFAQSYPHPGWVEQDAQEIWTTTFAVVTQAMAQISITPAQIHAIGIANQRETTICFDKDTGEPIYSAIVWQDKRTADRIEVLYQDVMEPTVRERTGLIPDAYFCASKIAWVLENVPGARQQAQNGQLLFGTVDTWLLWKLTNGAIHATDYTNASRTMLFDIHKLCWDEELLAYFSIPKSMMPQVFPSSSLYGETSLFGQSIWIGSMVGDQQAALFGQCAFEPGEGKNTYGTGCFLLMNTGNQAITSKHGLLTTLTADTKGIGEANYALEGSVFVAGAALSWLRDEMRMLRETPLSENYALRVQDTAGMYVVPAFAGLGAPYWKPRAKGAVLGMTRGVTKEHWIRAVLESIAYQSYDIVRAMEQDIGAPTKVLRVDGGASANRFLMQFQADLCKTIVVRPSCIETTALGAAYLAGLSTGFWKDTQEIRSFHQIADQFTPSMDEDQRLSRLIGWKKAVECAILWGE